MDEAYRLDVRKAMAYDLLNLLEEAPGKTWTRTELEKLLADYIDQQSR